MLVRIHKRRKISVRENNNNGSNTIQLFINETALFQRNIDDINDVDKSNQMVSRAFIDDQYLHSQKISDETIELALKQIMENDG